MKIVISINILTVKHSNNHYFDFYGQELLYGFHYNIICSMFISILFATFYRWDYVLIHAAKRVS